MTDPDRYEAPLSDWSLRPWILASLFAIAGLVIHLSTDGYEGDPWRMAIAALAFFGTAAFAFTIGEDRLKAPAIFAIIVGLAMGGLAYRVADAGERYPDAPFWFAAGVLAVALAIPLFQAGFHRLRWQTSYPETHYHVWTDAISVAGAMAFVGLSWATLALLNGLFQLLGIELIERLMEEGWFGWMFSGAAFGAALGVLRNQLKILGTLQNVVLLVLSILAVPLAVALLIFLVLLIASGGQALWDSTDNATPILLACAAGSFVLVNAIVRDTDENASKSKVLRWAGLALAFGIFPLTVFAAVSMGIRVGQHGLAPERIWALIAIAVAVAYGLAYWVSLGRGRLKAWADYVRRANLHLAVGVCAVALILALPLFNFGALSASNQLSRLASGDVSAEDFDYDALRWDFGDAGREALAGLAQSDNTQIAQLARTAQARDSRPWIGRIDTPQERDERREEIAANLRVDFDDPALEEGLRRELAIQPWHCNDPCVAILLGPDSDDPARQDVAVIEHTGFERFSILPVQLSDSSEPASLPADPVITEVEPIPDTDRPDPVTANSQVEVREWTGRQIYVDGKPVGQPFE